MNVGIHLRMLFMVSLAWVLFWIGGLPDYYLQYSAGTMAAFDLAILPPILWLIYRSVRSAGPGRAMTRSLWWAFYISVPLFFYDLVYCGLHLGHGMGFLVTYWYITVYYVLPWFLFPPMGYLIHRRQ